MFFTIIKGLIAFITPTLIVPSICWHTDPVQSPTDTQDEVHVKSQHESEGHVWPHHHKHEQREWESFQLGKPQQTVAVFQSRYGIRAKAVFDV